MSAKPTPLSGFPELLPEQRFVEQQVIDTLRRTFELHGFAGIETRAVEPMDQLLRKGETSKEVYVLRRLQADADGADSGMGLHFDLTVPFARYVLENAGKLEFPFRRYQIQKAWRGERPQEGRYREFTQADIDVVMKDELPFHFDVEVARVMAEALSGLPLPPLRLRVNNRKLIEGFYRGIGATDPQAVITIIDKLDKLPVEQVAALLVERRRPDRGAGRPVPAAGHDQHQPTPGSSTRCVPSAWSTSCSTRAWRSSPRSSTGAPRCAATGSRSRPASASPAGWTTTRAPSSRSTWSASSS